MVSLALPVDSHSLLLTFSREGSEERGNMREFRILGMSRRLYRRWKMGDGHVDRSYKPEELYPTCQPQGSQHRHRPLSSDLPSESDTQHSPMAAVRVQMIRFTFDQFIGSRCGSRRASGQSSRANAQSLRHKSKSHVQTKKRMTGCNFVSGGMVPL